MSQTYEPRPGKSTGPGRARGRDQARGSQSGRPRLSQVGARASGAARTSKSAADRGGPALEVTAAIENYLKCLDELSTRAMRQRVQVGELAQAVGVTPGTVTSMLRRLSKAGWVHYERYGGASLTASGQAEARRVIRRHRIIELFLVEVLGLDWSEVHDEAERLEHALSDKVLDRLDALLRRPTVDPHGDPIPALDGTMVDRSLLALADLRPRSRARVARILDQGAAFLRFADESGLRPGTAVEVVAVDRIGETMTTRLDRGEERTISLSAAWKVMVERARAGAGR